MTVAFTNASGARMIAVNSQLLQWSNVTSGASAVARAALNQAVVFAIDEQLGVSPSESTEIAVTEAERTVATMISLAAEAPEDLAAVAKKVAAAADRASAVVADIRDGNAADAAVVLDEQFNPVYTDLAATLAQAQAVYAAEIEAAEGIASRVEGALQWTAFLLVPGIAILLYRIALRRRYERRKLEFEARISAERELNVAKDEIIAGISHELRTPLTSILGFSQHLIETEMEDRAESLDLLTVINHDSQELARMVEDLLTAARLESQALTYDMVEVDLETEVTSITEQLRREDIELRTVGRPLPVWADSGRTRQILRNLLSNAIQHGGEKIYVEMRGGDTATTCDVVDDGDGVSAGIADRLFERFVHEGSQSLLTGSVGLGLAIARSLARAMGGDVAHRREDGLTIFSLELPIAPSRGNGKPREIRRLEHAPGMDPIQIRSGSGESGAVGRTSKAGDGG